MHPTLALSKKRSTASVALTSQSILTEGARGCFHLQAALPHYVALGGSRLKMREIVVARLSLAAATPPALAAVGPMGLCAKVGPNRCVPR